MRTAPALACFAALSAVGCGRIGFDLLPITSTGDAGRDAAVPADAAAPVDSGAPVDAAPPLPDAALDAAIPPCDEDPCKLVLPQCGCPEGEACQRTVRGEATRECVPPGDVERGQPCARNVDCVPGHACAGFSPPNGVCSRYCTSSAECGASSECTYFTAPAERIGACTAVCDAVRSTGCPDLFGCHLLLASRVEDDATVTVTLCGPADGALGGEDCTRLCAPGFICLADELCYEVCEVGDSTTCSVGGSCVAFDPPMRIGGTAYGFCQ